jgi:NAD(P)-dependent dehydrogenase (short-subunit alcohol dehydrogenase family)
MIMTKGWGTTKVLAKHGATVTMACRSQNSCETAKATILEELKGSNVKSEQLVCDILDLSSLKDVKRFAAKFKASGKPLDSLILNAGAMCMLHNREPSV